MGNRSCVAVHPFGKEEKCYCDLADSIVLGTVKLTTTVTRARSPKLFRSCA